MTLEPGYYANLFEVQLQAEEADVLVCERSKYPDLKSLRAEIERAGKEAFVYAPEQQDVVFGYGKEMEWLRAKGFTECTVKFQEQPRLTGRMILEGVIKKAQGQGYTPDFSGEIGRSRLFKSDRFRLTSDSNVRVFTGYDTRVIFLRDAAADRLSFNLIVDVCYCFKGPREEPLSFHQIATGFGSSILKEVRQIQGDLIPTGINTEVSRQRLLSEIIPFVKSLGEIQLPCKVNAVLSCVPSRIVVGARDESL